jgi:hypothetical protein
MKTVYKDGLERSISNDRVKEYQKAGWSLTQSAGKIISAEAYELKPPAKSKSAEQPLDNTITQGDL